MLKVKRDLMQTLFSLTHQKDVEEIDKLTADIEGETRQIKLEIEARKQ